MKIFVDETGVFIKTEQTGPQISGVGALVIPHSSFERVEQKYLKLRARFNVGDKEVKGSKLTEEEIAAVIDILRRNDAIFEVAMIDMAGENSDAVADHQRVHADNLNNLITLTKDVEFIADVRAVQTLFRSLPPQLYIQSVVASDVIHRVIRYAPTYYAQRQPHELGKFEWIIDAKDGDRVLKSEESWQKVLMPLLRSKSIFEPGVKISGLDYSALEKLDVQKATLGITGDIDSFLLNPIFKKFDFIRGINSGLEMVDIVTTATRRMLKGTLREEGWRGLSDLIIWRRGFDRIHMVTLGDGRPRFVNYSEIVQKLNVKGKRMMVDRLRTLVSQ